MKNKILFAAFISGMTLMIFEMVGARMIGPYFGTSMYVWSSIIGVIMASLSLGYWWGGKQADKNSSIKQYASSFLIAAFFILLVLLFKNYILSFLSHFVQDVKLAAILSSVFLFAVPSFFFGIISPYAIKLVVENVDETGATSGKVYSLSTLGSILGTFLGGFVLVPMFGIDFVLSICVGLMVLAAVILYSSLFKNAALFLVLALVFSVYSKVFSNSDIRTYLSPYSNITVYDAMDERTKKQVRRLMIDTQMASAKFLDSHELVHEYLNFYKLDKHIKPNLNKVLLVGGAACSYPNWLARNDENVEIDIIEIDEKLVEIAYDEFELLKTDKIKFFVEDARTFLNRNETKYDIIYMDAFNSKLSIPFQLTTQEAVQKMKNSISKDGAIIANIITSLNNEKNHFLRAELATFNSVFQNVYLFQVDESISKNEVQNFILIASENELALNSTDVNFNQYLSQLVKQDLPALPILTDQKAPVEMYMNKLN